MNAIVSFQFATIHNWHPRALHFLFLFPQVSSVWQEAGTFLLGLCFPSKEFLASFSGLYILRCWMVRTFNRGVFSVAFAVAFSSFVFSYSTLKKKTKNKQKTLLFCIGAQPINSVVTVSGEQQRDSVIHINVSILSQTSFSSTYSILKRKSVAINPFFSPFTLFVGRG